MNDLTPEQLAAACARAMYERDATARDLDMTVEDTGPGRATISMTVRPQMLNGHGICHGGFLFTLADTAFAYACNSHGQVNLAQSCSIDFVSPVRAGERLTAAAVQQFRAGRTGLYDVTVRRADGETVAHFRGRSYRVRAGILDDS
jgi:acyl-CoA thioesterase